MQAYSMGPRLCGQSSTFPRGGEQPPGDTPSEEATFTVTPDVTPPTVVSVLNLNPDDCPGHLQRTGRSCFGDPNKPIWIERRIDGQRGGGFG